MKKILLLSAIAVSVLEATAQDALNLDTYAGAQLATEDLNGTARYVGMGGAMDALGADISTIGSNPAGIGIFRKNVVSTSFGLNVQEDGKNFDKGTKTNASFDQLGLVLSTRMGATSYVNFGFNYHKSRNFDYVLSAANEAVNGSSLHRQTYVKIMRGDLDLNNNNNLLHPFRESQIDQLNYRIIDQYDEAGQYVESISPRGVNYMFDRAHTGYIGEYDFNLSGNINNRLYLGLTVGIHDVHYNSYSEYRETFEAPTVTSQASYNINYAKYTDDLRITGTGFNLKAGLIFRPIEESPFRIGMSVATPTWYKLKSKNHTTISDQYGVVDDISDNIEFRMDTPWKFGLSAGTTIGREWALGFGYEYADYGSVDMRSITNSYYDEWGDTYRSDSESDSNMKRLTEQTLNGVSTVKCGLEFRPDNMLSIRLGYNYVSAMYKEGAVRDQTIDSPGVYMSSTSDYTNWDDTHRLTCGFGLSFDQFRLDMAYQYSSTNGKFYPYMSSLSAKGFDNTGQPFSMTNECSAVKVNNKRHQLLLTLGYTF